MAQEHLRNVKTGETIVVETNSEEYTKLINEVYDHEGSARPKYEITGQHHVQRLDSGDIAEEDHGYEHKPIPGGEVDISEVGPEKNPHHALTEAEVEMGITSREQKEQELGLVTSQGKEVEPLEKSAESDREARGQEAAGSKRGRSRSGNGPRRSTASASAGSTETTAAAETGGSEA